MLLVALLVFWAPSGPAAREIATREPVARSGRSRSPPWPSGPSGALHTGGACGACVVACRLEARPGPAAAHRYRGLALLWSLQRRAKSSNAVQPSGGLQSVGTRCLFVARPGPAAAYLHRGRALLWSLRHYANPSNNERPGPQPHKQTLNNVRTRPVVQCLPMGRCAYPRLGLLVWAVHPIRRHYTPSVRVHRHVTGAAPRKRCSATQRV